MENLSDNYQKNESNVKVDASGSSEFLLPFEKVQSEVLVKRNTQTSDKFGRNPQDICAEELLNYGIININKPEGPTSHQVSAYVQNILGIGKSGHSGTLDPKVTGVLPTALGRGTRIVSFLLPAGKEYVCIMHLHDDYTPERIKEIMAKFVGKIKQMPPIKSAIKRQIRERRIYYINIHEIIGRDVLFTVGCQAGTYIRKLCHDIGVKLGSGGHMGQLIRTKAGPFKLANAWTLQDLSDAIYYFREEGNDKAIKEMIRPIEEAVSHVKKVWVTDTAVDSLCHGANLSIPGVAKLTSDIALNTPVAIMTLKDELVCLGRANMSTKDIMKNDKGLAIITEKVFMKEGIYPKFVRKTVGEKPEHNSEEKKDEVKEE